MLVVSLRLNKNQNAPRPSEHPPLLQAIYILNQAPAHPNISSQGYIYVYVYGQDFQQSMDQPGKVANPARDQLNRENVFFPVPVCA